MVGGSKIVLYFKSEGVCNRNNYFLMTDQRVGGDDDMHGKRCKFENIVSLYVEMSSDIFFQFLIWTKIVDQDVEEAKEGMQVDTNKASSYSGLGAIQQAEPHQNP